MTFLQCAATRITEYQALPERGRPSLRGETLMIEERATVAVET